MKNNKSLSLANRNLSPKAGFRRKAIGPKAGKNISPSLAKYQEAPSASSGLVNMPVTSDLQPDPIENLPSTKSKKPENLPLTLTSQSVSRPLSPAKLDMLETELSPGTVDSIMAKQLQEFTISKGDNKSQGRSVLNDGVTSPLLPGKSTMPSYHGGRSSTTGSSSVTDGSSSRTGI